MEEVGLHPIAYYVDGRRQTIGKFIVYPPIFDSCVEGRQMSGTCPHQWWWEQPMDLDAARAEAPASAEVAAEDDDGGGKGQGLELWLW